MIDNANPEESSQEEVEKEPERAEQTKSEIIVTFPSASASLAEVESEFSELASKVYDEIRKQWSDIGFEEFASKALVSGLAPPGTIPSEIILDEDGLLVTGTYPPEYAQVQQQKEIFVSYDDAASRYAVSADFYLSETREYLDHLKENSKFWEKISRWGAILGFAAIAGGIPLVFFVNAAAGVIPIILGALAALLTRFLYPQSALARERLDKVMDNILGAQRVLTALENANAVQDAVERDKLKAQIVKSITASIGKRRPEE